MPSLIHEPSRPRKPWRVDYMAGGKQRTRRFTSKKDAQVFIGDYHRRTHTADGSMTLREWVPQWIATHGGEWERRTVKERAETADKYIVPNLGSKRLRDIGRRHIREWRVALVEAGVTPYRAQRAYTILRACLGDAVDDDILPANPAAGIGTLGWRKRPQEPATLAEVEAIRAAMPAARDQAVVSLMAYAGLRPGEVMALRWVDVLEHAVTVRRGAGRESGETKTGSVRTIPLIAVLADDLAAVTRADGLVVGVRNWGNWRNRVWVPACTTAGVRVAPKVLRHTAASLWIAEHRTSREVAYLLGHSTPREVEQVYGHLFAEAQLSKRNPNIQTSAARERKRAHAASLRAKR